MNWLHLRNTLVNRYHERPQEAALVDHWLRHIREGIEGLARLGHPFHLVEGAAPPAREWPRFVYHLEKAPRGFYCLCAEDFEFLGPGWFNTLDEAKHADGMGEQFKRGGVFPTKGLPALVVDNDDEMTPLDRRRRVGLE